MGQAVDTELHSSSTDKVGRTVCRVGEGHARACRHGDRARRVAAALSTTLTSHPVSSCRVVTCFRMCVMRRECSARMYDVRHECLNVLVR